MVPGVSDTPVVPGVSVAPAVPVVPGTAVAPTVLVAPGVPGGAVVPAVPGVSAAFTRPSCAVAGGAGIGAGTQERGAGYSSEPAARHARTAETRGLRLS
ncbi:hypothetical protein GCM10010393_12330 [Streptomyces gobitricini]|uniref:Uncharacterized protein n=1 Tax=Streptomyces gobitricini TaxID=68211 RepID=A0ABP5YPY2_9ACTN